MLLSYKITGFFDHQYLSRETLSILDFLYRDSNQGKIAYKTTLLVECGQPCPVTPDMPKLTRGEFVWTGGSMATFKKNSKGKINYIIREKCLFIMYYITFQTIG